MTCLIVQRQDRIAQAFDILLEKGYYATATGRYGFSVYLPSELNNDPSKMVRVDYSTRINPSLIGSLRIAGIAFGYMRPTTHTLLGAGAPRTGVWAAYPTPSAIGDNPAIYTLGDAGQTAPYTMTVEEGGALAWSYVEATNGGNARVTVHLGATLISTTDIDTYGTGSSTFLYSKRSVVLGTGLAAGSYTVTVTALGTKDVSSMGYRLYDLGVDAVAARGYGGTTGFFLPSYSGDLPTSGNWEYAVRVRPSGSVDPADFVYCWGTHGNEKAISAYSLTLDSVDYHAVLGNTANYQGTRWAGKKLLLDYTMPLQWTGAVTWCNHQTITSIDSSGIDVGFIRTTVLDARIRDEYVGMVMLPDGDNGGYTTFDFFTLDWRQTVAVPPDPLVASITPDNDSFGCLCTGGDRQVSATVTYPGYLWDAYARDANSLIIGLATFQSGYFKVYSSVIQQGNTADADLLIPSGNVLRVKTKYTFRS